MSSILTGHDLQKPLRGMEIDIKKLELYLKIKQPLLFTNGGSLVVSQFTHGQSNPTYLMQINQKKFVLRKQPPGSLLHGAHDVLREAAIIQHLSTVAGVPVPRIVSICSDSSIIGTVFYIMEHIDGIVYTDPALPTLSPQQRSLAYAAAARVLAALHSIEVQTQFRNDCIDVYLF